MSVEKIKQYLDAAKESKEQHQRNRAVPTSGNDRVQQAMHWWNAQTQAVRLIIGSHLKLDTSTDVTNFYWG
ncbi:hypothetical protein Peetri_00044 [Pseudomonas phage vB_PpuM-Peetri]